MAKAFYILLPFCLMVAMAACERDNIILGQTVEGIQVTGTGSAFGKPDVVLLSLGVVAEEDEVEEALAAAADAMQKVLDSLKNNGVAEKDIQTQRFGIHPVYDYTDRERVLKGYGVTNFVSAKVRDIDRVGTIIDDAVAAGGKWLQVDSISFAIDDPTELKEQARVEAMKNAKAKAETLAELGDVELGKPVSISESVGFYPRYGYDSIAEAEDIAETPIEPGEMEVTVTVVVVYEID